MTDQNKKDDIKALAEGFFKDCEEPTNEKEVWEEPFKIEVETIIVKDINKHKFKKLVKLVKEKSLDLEDLRKYGLDLSEIKPRDFDSVEDFFNEFDHACLQQLYNYDEIIEKIYSPLENMEEYYGSWEKVDKHNAECSRGEDDYKYNN